MEFSLLDKEAQSILVDRAYGKWMILAVLLALPVAFWVTSKSCHLSVPIFPAVKWEE